MNMHNTFGRLSLTLAVLGAISMIGCTGGRNGSSGDDDDDTTTDLPNLPNNNVNINVNVSVTMAGSGSGNHTGENSQAGTDTYDGGSETDPGVLFVVNDSGLDIGELYITECDNLDDWGVNQLQGDYRLSDGEYVQIYGIPLGCWDFVAYDDDDEVAWYYGGAELTEEEPEFSLVLLPPEDATGDDDDAADDDDDAADDDDAGGDTATITIWNKSYVDLGGVTLWDWSTEENWYVCEWMAIGSNCEIEVDPGEYAVTGSNKSELCWMETDTIDVATGQDVDYYVSTDDVMCK